jgi:hypothetical protein
MVAAVAEDCLDIIERSRPAWWADAACRWAPAEITWFPTGSGQETTAVTAAAKEVCAACSALRPCRSWALNQGDRLFGIWGGLTEHERKQVLQAKRHAS